MNVAMGVGRIFSRGGQYGIYPKCFPGGAKSGEIWFLPLEIEKTTFFANNFKIQEGTKKPPEPPCPNPSDAHERSKQR